MGRRIVQGAVEQIDGLARALVGGLSSAIEPWLAPDVRHRLKPVEADAVAGAIYLARGEGA